MEEGNGEEYDDRFIDDNLAEETEEGRQGVIRNISTRGGGTWRRGAGRSLRTASLMTTLLRRQEGRQGLRGGQKRKCSFSYQDGLVNLIHHVPLYKLPHNIFIMVHHRPRSHTF